MLTVIDPALPTRAPTTAAPLRGRDVALVFVVSLGAMVLLGAAGIFLAATVVGASYALALGILGGTVGVWAGLWSTLCRRQGWGRRELGFVRPRRSLWHLLWQVPAAMMASLAGAALLGAALGLGPAQDPSSERELVDVEQLGVPLVVVLVLCSVLVVPAAEEVLFRRVLLDWALTRLPAGAAVPLVAVAFAAAHLAPVVMVYVVFLGLFTGLLRLWHDSLWPPLALHAVNNGLVVLLAVQALAG